MPYEYNGHLLEDERIELVANEIISKYPQIYYDKAKEIAMLEGRISTECNLEIVFNRLYNIMLISSDNKDIVSVVNKDLLEVLNNNKNDEKIDYYFAIAYEISDFLMNMRDFPLLDEF